MSTSLSEQQLRILRPYIIDRAVHDLGCGSGWLSRLLAKNGASVVYAIDKKPCGILGKNIKFYQMHLSDYIVDMEVVVLSWPINRDQIDFVGQMARSKIIVFLGRTTGGVACGNVAMWKWLTKKKLEAHVTGSKGCLMIWRNEDVERPPSRDELAGINVTEMYEHCSCE